MEKSLHETIRDLIFQYELAEQEIQRIRNEAAYSAAFAKVDELEEAKEQFKERLKRLLHTNDGPPDTVPLGHASHTFGVGDLFKVVVTYKKHADYYDPAKLPKATLTLPGIVLTCNTPKLDLLAAKDARVKKALSSGAWMTPSVQIKRRDV